MRVILIVGGAAEGRGWMTDAKDRNKRGTSCVRTADEHAELETDVTSGCSRGTLDNPGGGEIARAFGRDPRASLGGAVLRTHGGGRLRGGPAFHAPAILGVELRADVEVVGQAENGGGDAGGLGPECSHDRCFFFGAMFALALAAAAGGSLAALPGPGVNTTAGGSQGRG